MVLFRTTFPVFRDCDIPVFVYRKSVFIQFIHVRPADIEIVVGAVKVGDGHISFGDLFGMVKDPFFQFVLVLSDKIQAVVNIFQRKIIEFLIENVSGIVGTLLGSRVKRPAKSQKTADLVRTVLERTSFGSAVPEGIQLQFLIQVLQDAVTDIFKIIFTSLS